MTQPWSITDAGLAIPDFELLRKTTFDALTAPDALGGDYLFHPDDDMTQGIEVVLLQLASAYQCIEAVSSSRDPDQAQGALLREDGTIVGAVYNARARSTIAGVLVGAPGTNIPTHSILAYVPSGTPADLWETFEDYVIGAGGTVPAELQSSEYGPIEADAASASSWAIQTPIAGWTGGFLSTEPASLGKLEATDLEVREAIQLAGRGGAGAATYDTDVQNVAAVTGVSYVALFVNRTLVYDPVQDLADKRGRFVVEGGRKQDIIDAIATTESTGLNTIDTGTVFGVSTRFDKKEIETSYVRPVNVPILFRVTIDGSTDDGFPTTQEEVETIVFAAIETRMDQQDAAEAVKPIQYESAIVAAFPENAVDDITVEVRRDPLDAWQTTPLLLSVSLAERAVVRTGPTAGEVIGTAEEPLAVAAGSTLAIEVDGGAPQVVTFVDDHTEVATAAVEVQTQATGLAALDADGRLLIRSSTTGPLSSIQVTGGSAAGPLGLDALLHEGTDGDVQVIIV